MDVYISEYLCSGAWPGATLPASWTQEGRGMLGAAMIDLLAIDGLRVHSTWDSRLGPPPDVLQHPRLTLTIVGSPDEERAQFNASVAHCDACIVIAPETNGLLEQRVRDAIAVGGRVLGCQPDAINLTGDKLRTWELMHARGLPTIPTVSAEQALAQPLPWPAPFVLKPRDGAGAESTYVHADADSLKKHLTSLGEEIAGFIVQPFIASRALAVAVLVDRATGVTHVLPPATQEIYVGTAIRYLGGAIPAEDCDVGQVRQLVDQVLAAVPTLDGYFGIDLLEPTDGSPLLIVEVNPRLTASYVGYRRLCHENLMQRWLYPDAQPLTYRSQPVAFSADGNIRDER